MEWALRWFDTLDDLALIARLWWTEHRFLARSATLLALTFLTRLILH
jgi:hypothetical protein